MSKKFRLQMQRRQPVTWNSVAAYAEPTKEVGVSNPRNKINQYTCWTCHGEITTVDRQEGTTPAMLACRVTEGCNGTMHSHRYTCGQNLTPDYEWYKPEKLPRNPDMRLHVEMGGLMLRKIEAA